MKAYYLYAGDEFEGGIMVVEPNIKEARKHRTEFASLFGWEFIEIRCKLIKNANVEGLPRGEVEYNKDTVRRGIYSSDELEDICDNCGKYKYLSQMDDNSLICSNCEEMAQEK